MSNKSSPQLIPQALALAINKELRVYGSLNTRVTNEFKNFNKQSPKVAGLVLHRSNRRS